MTSDETASPTITGAFFSASPTDSLGAPDGEVENVRIRMLGPGHAEVLLHGVDIAADLVGFQLTAPDPKSPPELVLMLGARAACKAQYEGMARVVVGEPPDPGPAAAAFLSAIDPEILEQTALNRLDLDTGPHGTTKTMLRQLTEWAQGRSL